MSTTAASATALNGGKGATSWTHRDVSFGFADSINLSFNLVRRIRMEG